MDKRITGRLSDGTAYVRSETGNEGVGHFTTQRRLSEIIIKLAKLEDKIESSELVEVVRGEWKFNKDGSGTCNQCGITQKNVWDYDNWQNYCGHCGADMRKIEKR